MTAALTGSAGLTPPLDGDLKTLLRRLKLGKAFDALLAVELQSPGRGARTFDPATVQVTWKTG